MHDLLQNPKWEADTLGHPLPDSPHACAVSLPTWESVLGYEEQRPRVINQLKLGYPRFVLHPLVRRLFAEAGEQLASGGNKVVLFPHRAAAQRAQRYVEVRHAVAARVTSYEGGLQALVVPEEAVSTAMDYWRFSGEVVSSRLAEDLLKGEAEETAGSSVLVRERLAEIGGYEARDLFLYESGMAAIFATLRAVNELRPGKKTLQLEFPYVDTLKVQEGFGSGVVFLNEAEGEDFDQALRRIEEGEFAAVFCEVPSNPLMRSVHLPRVWEACQDGGVPLVVDDTVASVCNVEVRPYADLVTTSLTKWLSAKGDVMAGQVVVNPESRWVEEWQRFFSEDTVRQNRLYARDCRALQLNLGGVQQRMKQVNETAEVLAGYLLEHPAVAQVWYPQQVTRHEYDLVRREGAGYGGLLSFTLRQPRQVAALYDAITLCKGPSLGTHFSLLSAYTQLAHYRELDWAAACGVSPHLLRLSVGLEGAERLLRVLEEALERA